MAGIAKCLSTRKGGRYKGSPIVFSNNSSNNDENEKQIKSLKTTISKSDTIAKNSEIDDNDDTESDGDEGDCKSDIIEESMEGSRPAMPAEPGTLKVSLLDTPG